MGVAWMSMLLVRQVAAYRWWHQLKFWSLDNIPVVRQRRPVMNPPNYWSHPFPRFSYENSQIQIRFYSDPALPSCSEYLYPNESWRNLQFVLARNSPQVIHMHPLSDFRPWALRVPFSPLPHSDDDHDSEIQWRIVVKPRSEDTADHNTLWDIIPLRAWAGDSVGIFHASFLTSVNHRLLF